MKIKWVTFLISFFLFHSMSFAGGGLAGIGYFIYIVYVFVWLIALAIVLFLLLAYSSKNKKEKNASSRSKLAGIKVLLALIFIIPNWTALQNDFDFETEIAVVWYGGFGLLSAISLYSAFKTSKGGGK